MEGMREHEHEVDTPAVRRLWVERPRTAAPSRRRRIVRGNALTLEVLYAIDDLIVPTDLPRVFVCRVTHAHHVEGTVLQVLELAPLHGPWPAGTLLIRGSDAVRPATSSELWALRTTPLTRALDRWAEPRPRSAPPARHLLRRPVGSSGGA